MKQTSLFFFYLSFLLSLTSCLGDGGNSLILASQASVAELSPKQVLYVKGGDKISSDAFQEESVKEGDCFLVDFSLDYSLVENAKLAVEETGYYTAEISQLINVPLWTVSNMPSDTAQILDNEVVISKVETRNVYIQGKLFLFIDMDSQASDEEDNYELAYDATLPTSQDENGNAVFTLFLRATLKTEGTNTLSSMLIPNAFTFTSFMDAAREKAGLEANEAVYFRVATLKSYNREANSMTWQKSEILEVTEQ